MPKRKASASPPAPNKRHELAHRDTTPSTTSDDPTTQSLATDREEHSPNATAPAAASPGTRVSATATIASTAPEATSTDEDEGDNGEDDNGEDDNGEDDNGENDNGEDDNGEDEDDETEYEFSSAATARFLQAAAAGTVLVVSAGIPRNSVVVPWTSDFTVPWPLDAATPPSAAPSEAAASEASTSSSAAFDYVDATAANAVVQEAASEAPSPSATSEAPAASSEAPTSTSAASSPTPSTVIDHLSFPHIMDAIIAATDVPALSILALVNRKYYDNLYVGLHGIITEESGGLSFALAHEPSDKWIPATFREPPMTMDQFGSDAERLRRLRVVDMTVDVVSSLNKGKLHECIRPEIFRARPETCRLWKGWSLDHVGDAWDNRPFLPIVTKTLIFVLDNIARYHRFSGKFRRQSRNKHQFLCDLPTAQDAHTEGPEKVVLAVRYHPDRPARYNDLKFLVRAPIVVHFVKVDERSLDRHAPAAEGAFGARQVYRFLNCLGRAVGVDVTVTVTVVGLETINPWTFADDKSKAARIAHLHTNAREQQIRHLFETGPSAEMFGPPAANFQFVTAKEYAQGVSPTMLALERAEGFPIK